MEITPISASMWIKSMKDELHRKHFFDNNNKSDVVKKWVAFNDADI